VPNYYLLNPGTRLIHPTPRSWPIRDFVEETSVTTLLSFLFKTGT